MNREGILFIYINNKLEDRSMFCVLTVDIHLEREDCLVHLVQKL